MIKKLLSLSACALLALTPLASCGSIASAQKSNSKPHIVCTIFPEYDWVNQILGSHADDFEVTYLLSNGSDLHNFQPSIDDIAKISTCDLFIYTGGESDKWAEDAVKNSPNANMKTISLLHTLGDSVKEEELKEGMQECENEEGEEHGDEPEYDEHVWLSLENAETICKEITLQICSIDSENSDEYQENSSEYINKLSELDSNYRAELGSLKNTTLIFADRFPFRYLTDEYGLDYFSAFAGCSAETQASFETITFLAQKADLTNADTIFTIEGSDNSIANAVINATEKKNQKIVSLNSIQSVSQAQIDSGATYLSIMEQNLNKLKEALD